MKKYDFTPLSDGRQINDFTALEFGIWNLPFVVGGAWSGILVFSYWL